MIELPYFKFHPNQWLTGTISFLEKDVQGAYMLALCYYWSKNCEMPLNQLKMIIPDHYQQLIDVNLFKIVDGQIKIKFLDEQYKERKQAHENRVKNGRKGGIATAKLKRSSSDTQALRKDNKRKEKKYNDPALNNEAGINEFLKQRNDSKAVN
jgi:uncharacterized protein YdaU (DUF1376 family)